MTTQKQFGTIEDVPVCPSSTCGTITTQAIRSRLASEAKGFTKAVPGICRFCRRVLPAQFIKIPMPGEVDMEYPLLQCDRVARLYDQMDAERRQDFEQKAGHAATTRKSDF